MASEQTRIVVDTNIWVSFLIGKTLEGFAEHLQRSRVVVLQSQELFGELLEVLNRPRFQRYFSPDDVRELVELIDLRSEWIEPTSAVQLCRDPKDDFLLDLCLAGKADVLVTGDEDLLTLERVGSTAIVHYRDLVTYLNHLGLT